MTSEQICREFFARKGGVQMIKVFDGRLQVERLASQVIYITAKQADWLLGVARREGIARQDFDGKLVGQMSDGATWSLLLPRKNGRQKAASLQILN